MILITEANRNITSSAGVNNYKQAIKDHGYTFHYVDAQLDRQVLFFAIEGKQVAIDFRNQIYYKCEKFNIISLGFGIENDVYKEILQNFNGEREFKNIPQGERIINIVNLVI